MASKPKVLFVGESNSNLALALNQASDTFEVLVVPNPLQAMAEMAREQFVGVYLGSEYFREAFEIGRLLRNEQILEEMPDGVALLDSDHRILWANSRFYKWSGCERLLGTNFYAALGSPDILGPELCPFRTALATGQPTSSTLHSEAKGHYYQVHAAPVVNSGAVGGGRTQIPPRHLIITVREVTSEKLQQQKLAAIYKAGMDLANLTAEELFQMSVQQRIDLLKSNIVGYTKGLLHYEVVEIRLLDQKTGRLEPLLSEGIEPESATRELYAQPQNNGVTGFVAATGQSYLCEDTTQDPLYLEGARGAKSSMTVPLVLHDEVIGTFNVESLQPHAFTDGDLQFLELFSRNVAVALNTLELLVAEKATAAAESIEAVHSAVALPVDEILNDAVNVMERYIGYGPELGERLQRILRNARDIKQVIQKVGQRMSPAQAHPQTQQVEERPVLRDRRVLVVDADETVRSAAHALLERYGCIVETAPDGGEAIDMVRNLLRDSGVDGGYDSIIADIRLPDMTGFEFFTKLQELIDPVPLILMTGYGYDPGHSIVKARQAGVQAVLYKPFRLDQLLQNVEMIIASRPVVQET